MAGELIRREALERIIQRAAELQAGERDIGEGLTEADVLALGQDVGIPTRYLRQALLEEQTRSVVTGGTGLFAWLTGPSLLTAERVVPGDRGAVERALTVWMEREESLQVKRRYADRTTWEPRVGAFASIQRALGAGGKTFALARATEVGGQVTQLETGFCHVRLVADVRGERARRLWGAALLVLWGAVLAGVLPALGALAPWAAIPTAAARHAGEKNGTRVAWRRWLAGGSTAKSSPGTPPRARPSNPSAPTPGNSPRPSAPPPRGRGPGASWLIPVRERNDRDTAGRGAGVRADGGGHRAGRRHPGVRDDGVRVGAARSGQGTRGRRGKARPGRSEGAT